MCTDLYLYLGGDKMRIVRYRVNTAMDTKYTIALISDLHGMFHAEILLSGLGAIMDVSVAISVALSEIVRKNQM